MNGEVVFAGYGLSVPEYDYDDFAQVDVRNKIVLVLAGAPLSDRPDSSPRSPRPCMGRASGWSAI